MKKYFIVLFLLFAFCGDNSEQTPQPEASSTDTTEAIITAEEESTTTTEIVQLDSFEGTVYEILKDKSKVGYLAPKQFLNAGLETVEGVTSEIIGEFTLELSECDQSDSCLYITNLLIRVDISTLKSNNSIRDSAIKSQWLESKLFPEAVFKIDELVIPNKNFDSKVEDTIVGKLSIREIELEISKRYADQRMRCPTHLSVGQELVWYRLHRPVGCRRDANLQALPRSVS